MLLDSRGRLLGKLNLLDLIVLLFLLSLGGTFAYTVGVSRYRLLAVVSMEPQRIVAGPGKYVVLKGTGFDPSTTIRLGDYPPRGGVYWDESTLGIQIGQETDAGVYRVSVRDGRGRSAVLSDRLEVFWAPQILKIRQRVIYPTGEGARIDILGKFFTYSRSVRIGDRELDVSDSVDPERISAHLKQGDAPLPLGEQLVTVTNAGGQSVTWEQGVTVVPAPEVHSVAPDRIVLGDTVDLFLYGRHLRDGSIVWLQEEKRPVGQATLVSPDCLRVRLKTDLSMSARHNDVILELPDGPKVKVLPQGVHVNNAYEVFMVAAVLLDDQSARAIREFKGSLEWKLKPPLGGLQIPGARRNFNLDGYPVLELLLPARVEIEGGKLTTMDVRSRPLRKGDGVWFTVQGQELSGIVISEPFAVFSDDYFADKRPL